MPQFEDETTTPAAPEDVWKLLHDPTRLPLWWVGFASVEDVAAHGTEGQSALPDPDQGSASTGFTMYPTGYPDLPMPQEMRTHVAEHRVVVSCQVHDLVFEWSLLEDPGTDGTRILVHVDIPEQEAGRLPEQRDAVRQSLRRLGDLATTA